MSENPISNLEAEEAPSDLNAIIAGAALVFIISIIPIVGGLRCICLAQIAGTLLAIHLYTKKSNLTISAGKGILLGLQVSLLGGILASVVGYVLLTMFGIGSDGFTDLEPAQLEQMEQLLGPEMIEDLKNGKIPGVFLGVLYGMMLVIDIIGGLIGGAIGAAVFKRAPAE